MARATLPLGNLYQLGFLTHDLDAGMARLRDRYGVTHFRRRQATAWMETAHAYAGESMLELIRVGPGAPALYTGSLPAPGQVMRLHHLGRRIADAAGWEALQAAIASSGLDVPMQGEIMNGGLKYAYVDTREDLGLYSEYVCLIGEAEQIYDDVPHNEGNNKIFNAIPDIGGVKS